MRKREREEKKQRRRYIERTTEEGKRKGVFGTHARGVFGTSRRAGRRCRGLVGVARRAWLGVGLEVVVAMSLSLFTARAG